MARSAMHDLAEGAAAMCGGRLQDETHGKADFLACACSDEPEDTELGLIRTLHGRRNQTSYDDLRIGQSPTGRRLRRSGSEDGRVAIAEAEPREGNAGDTAAQADPR